MHAISACRCSPAREVVEAKLLLELPVALPAGPARLDRAGQDAPGRAGRQVGQVEFAPTRGASLAHQPDLVARQMAVVGPDRAVAHPHAGHGKPGRERALRVPPPRHAPPGQRSQSRLGLPRLLIRRGFACPAGWRHEPPAGIVDLLVLRDAHRPGRPARIEGLTKNSTAAIAGKCRCADAAEPFDSLRQLIARWSASHWR